MNVEHVVTNILDSDSDSNWNKSEKEREEGFDSKSFQMDRLSIEQGKLADKCGSVALLNFLYNTLKMVKTMGKMTTVIDLMIATLDFQV